MSNILLSSTLLIADSSGYVIGYGYIGLWVIWAMDNMGGRVKTKQRAIWKIAMNGDCRYMGSSIRLKLLNIWKNRIGLLSRNDAINVKEFEMLTILFCIIEIW